MKRLVVSLVLIALLACLLSGCITYRVDALHERGRNLIEGSDVTQEQSFEVDAFDAVVLEGNMTNLHVFLSTGDNAVSVECDSLYFDELSVKVRGGKLTISTDWLMPDRIDIYISAPEYTLIDCKGAAEIVTEDQLLGEKLRVVVTGAADCDMDIAYEELELELAGAGSLKMRGTAEKAYIDCAGACDISARNLTTQTCEVTLAGAGSIEIRCEKDLEATIAGIGSINYWGNPSVRRVGAGFGSVTSQGD